MNKKVFLKVLPVLLALLMLLSACGTPAPAKKDEAEQGKSKPKVAALFPVPDPATGGGFDRANMAGLKVLEEELGWTVSIADNVPYPKLNETAISYLSKGYDMIMYCDAGMAESFTELPKQYPDKWFIMCSTILEIPDLPNVAAYSPDFIEWGMITGMAMGRASKTGKIGILGGSPIPVLREIFSGIIEGAKYVNPNIEYVVYWSGDWNDTARHSELTKLMVDEGCDITFACTGAGAKGVYEAAEATGTLTMGFAWDVYDDNPKAILSSLKLNTPKSFKELGESFEKGTLKNEIVTLNHDYFAWADFRGSASEEVEKDIIELTEKFMSGEIKIPLVLHDEIMK